VDIKDLEQFFRLIFPFFEGKRNSAVAVFLMRGWYVG